MDVHIARGEKPYGCSEKLVKVDNLLYVSPGPHAQYGSWGSHSKYDNTREIEQEEEEGEEGERRSRRGRQAGSRRNMEG